MKEAIIAPYWQPLSEALKEMGSPEIAAGAEKYMRNKYVFFGVKSPERKQLLAEFIQQYGLPKDEDLGKIVLNAWQQPEREFQYVAMELLQKRIKKLPADTLELCETLITEKSWWDTVDFVAPNLVGVLLTNFPAKRDPLIEKWMVSGNFWLQRSCLLFQLRYKEKTDQELLFALCERLSGEKEFFIRKAIGWALRQHAKFFPKAVESFVESTNLQALSKKEALKHF